jgi:hypothetical protein
MSATFKQQETLFMVGVSTLLNLLSHFFQDLSALIINIQLIFFILHAKSKKYRNIFYPFFLLLFDL